MSATFPALTRLTLALGALALTLGGCAAATDDGAETSSSALVCGESATKKVKAKGDECQTLRITCPLNWYPFTDDCGCGCKIDTCEYVGKKYTTGEKFLAVDACSVCTCGKNGAITCDDTACTCNPAREPNRAYIGSPAQCASGTVPFSCPRGSIFFKSDCGCGCEDVF